MAGSQFSLTTFSSQGKLHQIEYAFTAVKAGDTSLGIKAKNGVVLATEKKTNSILVDETSVHKTETIGRHVGASYAGIGADFRVLAQKSRKKSIQYFQKFLDNVPISVLCHEIASIVQEFTQRGGVRPFGISMLMAGCDQDGPHLFQVDPSGAYFEWKASAIGRNMDNAKTFLEKRYNEDMELDDAIHTALLTLKEGFEGEMDENNIELGVVSTTDGAFRILTPEEVRDHLSELQ